LAYSALWSSIKYFSVDSNHSHNGTIVRDKHEKAFDFMVTMESSDSCIDFAAETKAWHIFFTKRSYKVMPRILC